MPTIIGISLDMNDPELHESVVAHVLGSTGAELAEATWTLITLAKFIRDKEIERYDWEKIVEGLGHATNLFECVLKARKPNEDDEKEMKEYRTSMEGLKKLRKLIADDFAPASS